MQNWGAGRQRFVRLAGAEKRNPRHSALLLCEREAGRDRERRGADHEFAAVDHSITSVAWSRSDCGMVSPSALAVLRLMTKSNLVGCSTGRSPGLAPFKMRST